MLDMIIKNGRIVNEDTSINADIAVKDGKITAIGNAEYFEEAEKVIDAAGRKISYAWSDRFSCTRKYDNGRIFYN